VRKGLLRGAPGWGERNDAKTPDVRVTTPHFSRPVLNFQVALREQPPLTEVLVAHLKSKLPERVYTEDWFTADEARFKATALRILPTKAMKGTVTPSTSSPSSRATWSASRAEASTPAC
jgi:hypothetical protein